jgi:uncharacterized tellurite resistance protein B-like protein
MLDRLKKMFGEGEHDPHEPGQHTVDELHLAAAVLLVETARMDDTIGGDERSVIVDLVRARFGLTGEEVSSVVELADEVAHNAVELSRFTRRIRDGFDHDERVEMVEMLWRVVYADGVVHDHEANLLRRVAGLLYVSDRESGEARKRAMS